MFKFLSKTGFPLQFSIFLVIAGILWIPALVQPLPHTEPTISGPLYAMIAYWLRDYPFVSVLSALLLVVIQAFLFHILLSANDLVPRDSFIDAIIFLVLASWNPAMLYLHPALPAGIFILISLYMLMRMYGQSEPYQYVFTSAFSIAVASLFYQPAIYLAAGLWISLLTYRIASWREWFISVIGLLLPFIYLVSYYYWQGELNQGFQVTLRAIKLHYITDIHLNTIEVVFFLSSVLVLFICIFMTLNSIQDKLISIRRKSWILLDFTIAGMAFLVLAPGTIRSGYVLVLMPMAFFLTYAVISPKKGKFINILLFLFIALLFVLHYIFH